MIPKIIVNTLNCNKIKSPIVSSAHKNIRACIGVISPAARGRCFVRSTDLSRLRSHKSFTTQPAPRMIIAPIMKRAVVFKVVRLKFSNPPVLRAIPHNPGSSRSQMPIGRSIRMR